MPTAVFNFALEYPGDRRGLRDYFYEACKCTHFWTGPMSSDKGPPDAQVREHYAVHNNYNLIDLHDHRSGDVNYKTDVVVTFTFNKGADVHTWRTDVLDACVRWLARSAGDAFLDIAGGPVLGRIGGDPVRIDDTWASGWSQDEKIVEIDLPVVLHALKREELAYDRGRLQPYWR